MGKKANSLLITEREFNQQSQKISTQPQHDSPEGSDEIENEEVQIGLNYIADDEDDDEDSEFDFMVVTLH